MQHFVKFEHGSFGGWRPRKLQMWGFWEALFLGEEVFFALSSLEGDKALGSDGFTMTFWH